MKFHAASDSTAVKSKDGWRYCLNEDVLPTDGQQFEADAELSSNPG